MTTVNVVTATVAQDFPAGTTDTTFTFTLTDAAGTVVQSVSSTDGTASFSDVAVGEYTVTGTKNGVSASAPVSVVAPVVSLQVPSTLTVTLS